MLNISIVDSRTRLRLVLKGTVIAPWVAELRRTWEAIRAERRGRKLVIEFRNVTLISQEGENALLDLMRAGARFSCDGVFTRQVIQQLARRCKLDPRELLYPTRSHNGKQKERR
jgi:hypothetical protein